MPQIYTTLDELPLLPKRTVWVAPSGDRCEGPEIENGVVPGNAELRLLDV